MDGRSTGVKWTDKEERWKRRMRHGGTLRYQKSAEIRGASGEFQCRSAVQREWAFSWSVCGAPVVFQPINPLHVFNTGRMCRQRSAEGCMAITQRPTSERRAWPGTTQSTPSSSSVCEQTVSSAEVWKGMDLLKLRPLTYSLNDSQHSLSVFWVGLRMRERACVCIIIWVVGSLEFVCSDG